MNSNKILFSTFQWMAASFALMLTMGACSRQVAITNTGKQLQYVQAESIHRGQPVGKEPIIAAQKSPEGPLAIPAPASLPQPVALAKTALKHSPLRNSDSKTQQTETAKNTVAINYISHRHHSTVRNADIRVGGLISGILLLILGSILYIIPGPVGYILGTVVVIIAVFIIVFAII